MSHVRLAPALAAALALAAGSASAANWLMLQGTENPKAPDFKVFGFVQPTYYNNFASPIVGGPDNGKVVAQNLIAPRLKSQRGFDLTRADIGVRGKLGYGFNYFALLQVGQNNMTYDPFGNRARAVALDHLSITANQIPDVRVRAGLFKNPGSEEVLQGAMNLTYIDFTDFTARENLERFVTGVAAPAGSSQGNVGTPVTYAYGFSAGRDWGVQLFDSFKRGRWDYSYAFKVGRGEAISTSHDNRFHPELYFYGSAEYNLPGGRGPFKNGIKLYAWRQQGKRDFSSDPLNREYTRIRQGIGFRALGKLFGSKYKQRVQAELMQAQGVIFLAPVRNVPGNPLQMALGSGNKALGWYLDYGFFLNRHWEFDVRYDKDDLLYHTSSDVNPGNQRNITGLTLGVNYHFTPLTRLTVDYEIRKATAPTAYQAEGAFTQAKANATTNAVRNIVGNLDNRLAVQLTWYF